MKIRPSANKVRDRIVFICVPENFVVAAVEFQVVLTEN